MTVSFSETGENAAGRMALAIAGSDPSGGAGIQADLKTFTVLGIYGGAVITALTAQNTRGVSDSRPVPATFVRQQFTEVLSDLPVSHIKIGMVGTMEIAETLGELLEPFQGLVVYDPVLRATSGDPLFNGGRGDLQPSPLLAVSSVLTPNIFELEALTGRKCPDCEAVRTAGRELLRRYPRLQAVCLKGGHLQEEHHTVVDELLLRRPTGMVQGELDTESLRITHPRVASANLHGSGCTFASAFTAFHLLSGNLKKAFTETVHFMDYLIRQGASIHLGHGRGPLLHHLWQTRHRTGSR